MKRDDVAFYSAVWRGGAGRYVFLLASAIADAGTPITLIAPQAEPAERDVQESGMLKRVILPQGAGGIGSFFYRAMRSGQRILASFVAIVQARFRHSTYLVTFPDWLHIGFIQLLLIRILGARLIYIVHDAKPHAWFFPKQLRWLELAMLKGSYHLPSHLVTLTRAARLQLIEEFGVYEHKISVIPHGAFESPSMPEMRGDSVLLLFGMLRRNKHIVDCIRAMSLLPSDCPAQLIIAGAIHAEDPDYWAECSAALTRNGARIRTEIAFIPEERVEQLLSECDAVLLPYDQFNSQSGVAIQAGLAGRSLIATDVGGIGELIAGGVSVTSISRPVTAESIAAAITAYCGRNTVERRGKAQETKELLKEMLSWSEIGKSYSVLLQRISQTHPD
ncbi:MAG: glycosyltransferase family 4 protein [Anaerolineaceae bacterium]|nr:glycosyltransferase family 4 protein [Anaerolineaceae bacterium]